MSISFVLLISINSFATSVTDNDGSSFITKAEFDALKSSFQSQIDAYNSSIDSKIDSAIASYLSGIRINTEFETKPYIKGLVWSVSSDYRPRYVYAPPRVSEGYGHIVNWDDVTMVGSTPYYGSLYCIRISAGAKRGFNNNPYGQSKLWIDDLIKSSTSGKSVASWQGYDIGAKDEVNIENTSVNKTHTWGSGFGTYTQITRYCKDSQYTDADLLGEKFLDLATAGSINQYSINPMTLFLNSIKNYYGTTHMENIVLYNKSLTYDCFSNKKETKNWCYKGASEVLYTTFKTSDISAKMPDLEYMFDTTAANSLVGEVKCAPTHKNGLFAPYERTDKSKLSAQLYYETAHSDRANYRFYDGDKWYWRGAGFETKYLTDFNQLYNANLENLANRMNKNNIKGYNSLLTGPDGNVHIGINAGLPIVQLKKDQTLSMKLKLRDINLDTTKTSATYGTATDDAGFSGKMYIWAKSTPFTTNDPNSEADLEIEGSHVVKGTSSDYNKGYEVTNSTDPIEIKANDDCIIWLKWSMDAKKGGGVLEIPETIILKEQK